jgi:DNA-directed RNA polymerase specialized sigma24 family protein
LVWDSRRTLSGVTGDHGEEDLLAEVQQRIFKRLGTGKYVEDGRFKAFVLTVSYHVFVDRLAWRPFRPDDKSDGKASKPRGAEGRKSKGEAKNPHVQLDDAHMVPCDDATYIMRKDILNLVLDGLRKVENEDHAQVWTARVLLGKDEKEVGLLFGLNPNTCKSHFRRASIEILGHINAHPDYPTVQIEGLRALAEKSFTLEESDLARVSDAAQRDALRAAAAAPLSLRDLGQRLGQTPAAALSTLRAGIATLAKANMRRVKAPALALDDEAAAAALWAQVDKMIACYPKPLPHLRADAPCSPGESQLAALCQIGVILGFGHDGEAPAKTFSDLVGERVTKEGVNATATALGLDRQQLLALLAGELSIEKLHSAALTRLAKHFGLDREPMIEAIKASAAARPASQTRSQSPEQRQRYLDSVRRRVLGASAKS